MRKKYTGLDVDSHCFCLRWTIAADPQPFSLPQPADEVISAGDMKVYSRIRQAPTAGKSPEGRKEKKKKRISKASYWQGVLKIVLRKVLFLSAFARKLDS